MNVLAQLLPEDINEKLRRNNFLLKNLSTQISVIRSQEREKKSKSQDSGGADGGLGSNSKK